MERVYKFNNYLGKNDLKELDLYGQSIADVENWIKRDIERFNYNLDDFRTCAYSNVDYMRSNWKVYYEIILLENNVYTIDINYLFRVV